MFYHFFGFTGPSPRALPSAATLPPCVLRRLRRLAAAVHGAAGDAAASGDPRATLRLCRSVGGCEKPEKSQEKSSDSGGGSTWFIFLKSFIWVVCHCVVGSLKLIVSVLMVD